MRRTMALLALAAVGLVPAPAWAVTSVQSGWWMSAPLAAPPDVPAGGLLLQGGPTVDEPVAYGALSFALADGEEAGELTLTVAPNSATTPNASVTVCPLTDTFTPAEGAPAEEGPAFDCTSSAVAERSDDGATFTVDASAFAAEGTLAIAVLPTALTDRVVLEGPTPTSLTTTTDRPSTSSSSSSSSSGSGSTSSSGASSTGGGTSSAGQPVAVPRTPQPSTSVSVPTPTTTAAAPAAGGAPATGGAPVETAAASGGGGSSSNRGIAFVALVALMGALWMFAGSPQGKQQELEPAQP